MTDRHVLLVDDDVTILSLLKELLVDEGYRISTAKNGREALGILIGQKPDLLIMDISLPDMSGLDVLGQMSAARNPVPVLLITAYGSSSDAIKGVQLGALDFITKPFDLDKLVAAVHKALDAAEASPRQIPSGNVPRVQPARGVIIGLSEKMVDVYRLIGKIASSDVTVMITGETGTGKELVASAIHSNSTRRTGPFIKVACAALPESLLESELFGHEKGAFTSAIVQHKGRFELADGGTIFLDEVGEMTLGTQKKLLRVLQEREFERVGGTKPIPVNVRVIAATNRRLEEEVEGGRFRQDLYYRLNVIAIGLPPLRERMDDLPQLIEHFLDKHRAGPGQQAGRISQEAVDLLVRHSWPGNVRELENVMERAVVLSGGHVITADHLRLHPLELPHGVGSTRHAPSFGLQHFLDKHWSLPDAVADLERQVVMYALIESNRNIVQTAKRLGLSRQDLQRKLRLYGLDDLIEDPPAQSDAPEKSAISTV